MLGFRNPKPDAMTQSITSVRPQPDESGEYFKRYIDLVPKGDVIETLSAQADELSKLIRALPERAQGYAYAEGKWSVNQLLGHVLDSEWIFASRCLWFARGNAGPLPGMDQDEFVAGADFDSRSLTSLITEFEHVRQASLVLFRSFDQTILDRSGVASDCKLSVRALMFLTAGHVGHHIDVFRERYLPGLSG